MKLNKNGFLLLDATFSLLIMSVSILFFNVILVKSHELEIKLDHRVQELNVSRK